MSSSMPTLLFIGTSSPSFFKVFYCFLDIHHVSCCYPSGFFLIEFVSFHQVVIFFLLVFLTLEDALFLLF